MYVWMLVCNSLWLIGFNAEFLHLGIRCSNVRNLMLLFSSLCSLLLQYINYSMCLLTIFVYFFFFCEANTNWAHSNGVFTFDWRRSHSADCTCTATSWHTPSINSPNATAVSRLCQNSKQQLWVAPATGQAVCNFITSFAVSARTANHSCWLGSHQHYHGSEWIAVAVAVSSNRRGKWFGNSNDCCWLLACCCWQEGIWMLITWQLPYVRMNSWHVFSIQFFRWVKYLMNCFNKVHLTLWYKQVRLELIINIRPWNQQKVALIMRQLSWLSQWADCGSIKVIHNASLMIL